MARTEYSTAPGGFSSPSSIDLTDLMRLADNDNDGGSANGFVEDIIDLFLQLAPRLRATAEQAVYEADGGSLARACHKLRSQAAFFGAMRLVRVCRTLEELGLAQDTQRAQRSLCDLEDELDRVTMALSLHRG